MRNFGLKTGGIIALLLLALTLGGSKAHAVTIAEHGIERGADLVCTVQTTDANPTRCTRLRLRSGQVLLVEVTATCKQIGGSSGTIGDGGIVSHVFVVTDVDGTVSSNDASGISATTVDSLSISDPDVNSPDDHLLDVRVTGDTDETVQWTVYVHLSAVSTPAL